MSKGACRRVFSEKTFEKHYTTPNLSLPEFSLSPYKDLTFKDLIPFFKESNKVNLDHVSNLSKVYSVYGDNEVAIEKLFMKFDIDCYLLEHEDFCVDGNGNQLIIYLFNI